MRLGDGDGADGVLMNTAIAEAQDAVLMAEAMDRLWTLAARRSWLDASARNFMLRPLARCTEL